MWINCQIIMFCMLFLNVVVADDKETNTTLQASPGSQEPSDAVMSKVRLLLKAWGGAGERNLKRISVTNKTVTCNDGSVAGYYLKKSIRSRKWIVYLEGGGFCSNITSCQKRWKENRDLMTSFNWTDKRQIGGILSSNPTENPFWHNANHVFVPYCSSDSWAGTKVKIDSEYSFMGAEIVTQVIRDLIPTGLGNANSLLLAGSSAGGTGVMLNLDRVKYLLHHVFNIKHIAVRGICDSGWFLDHPPYSPMNFSPIEEIKNGISYWKANIPKSCTERYRDEPWRCFFGYRLYPYINAPVFIFQWLYDEEQLSAVNVRAPNKSTEWDFVYQLSQLVRETLEDVSAVFAPSCISHSILTKPTWSTIKIDEISLPHSLHCWDKNPPKSNSNSANNANSTQVINQTCAKLPRTPTTRSGEKKRKNKNNTESNEKNNDTNGTNGEKITNNSSSKERKDKNKRRRDGRRHSKHGSKNNTTIQNGRPPNKRSAQPNKRKCTQGNCHYRLIESCLWPHCNHDCPKIIHPDSHEEVRFLDIIKSFGADLSNISRATGIDEHTLNDMGHTELLNLLTQRKM
ncbi:palmitoleoyl-protein carboxylesterase NOTUM [Aphidius gifuensis]|uniref:palmitoleoyl-protein carboxylesterase NOTUM n=1 Tax=Aphidius gifuensis TaxID=684658 RepID=UPI001CDD6A98|nr:palmitoleoyl-protein carboxylesterase NOTUM [Aphidius gifuensis]